MWGSLPKTLGLNLMLGLFLFDGHSDWIEGNYQQFVKPAVARGLDASGRQQPASRRHAGISVQLLLLHL
jgi:hypothetical protein